MISHRRLSYLLVLVASTACLRASSAAGNIAAPVVGRFTRGPDVTHIFLGPDSPGGFAELQFGMAGSPRAGRAIDVLFTGWGLWTGELPLWRQHRQAYAHAYYPGERSWAADSGRLWITTADQEHLTGRFEVWLRQFPRSFRDTVPVLRAVRGRFTAQRDTAAERQIYPTR
jgi:hypothetical protein